MEKEYGEGADATAAASLMALPSGGTYQKDAKHAPLPGETRVDLDAHPRLSAAVYARACVPPRRAGGVGRPDQHASPGRGAQVARSGTSLARSTGVVALRQQIVKTKPESQWIVTTRPLYHLQEVVSYSSRLQVIHHVGSGNCDRSRLMQYVCAWLPRRGRPQSFRHGF